MHSCQQVAINSWLPPQVQHLHSNPGSSCHSLNLRNNLQLVCNKGLWCATHVLSDRGQDFLVHIYAQRWKGVNTLNPTSLELEFLGISLLSPEFQFRVLQYNPDIGSCGTMYQSYLQRNQLLFRMSWKVSRKWMTLHIRIQYVYAF